MHTWFKIKNTISWDFVYWISFNILNSHIYGHLCYRDYFAHVRRQKKCHNFFLKINLKQHSKCISQIKVHLSLSQYSFKNESSQYTTQPGSRACRWLVVMPLLHRRSSKWRHIAAGPSWRIFGVSRWGKKDINVHGAGRVGFQNTATVTRVLTRARWSNGSVGRRLKV